MSLTEIITLVPLGVLFGTYFGQYLSTSQFKKRIAHEVALKARESRAQMQAEVFLEAADVVSRAIDSIVKMPFRNLVEINAALESIQAMAMSSKICVVASEDTVHHYLKFTSEFGKQFLRLLLVSSRIERLRLLVAELNSEQDELLVNQKQLVEAIEIAKINGEPAAATNHLMNKFEEITSAFNAISKQRNLTVIDIDERNRLFTRECFDVHGSITSLLTEFNLSIRREMGFELDEEAFRKRMNDMFVQARSSLHDFLEKLDADIRK